MAGRFCLLLLLLLSSCAEPKYQQDSRGETAREEIFSVLTTDFPASGFSAWLTWEQLPTEESYGSFLLKVGRKNRADNSPIPQPLEGDLEVELWMPSMGHGSSPVALEEIDTGTYRATDVFFTMPGDWEIRIRRKQGGNLVEEAVFLVRR